MRQQRNATHMGSDDGDVKESRYRNGDVPGKRRRAPRIVCMHQIVRRIPFRNIRYAGLSARPSTDIKDMHVVVVRMKKHGAAAAAVAVAEQAAARGHSSSGGHENFDL